MRTARIRTFLRGHTPTFLYDRGLVIGKVEDCGHHVWYVEGRDLDEGLVYFACYHCERQVDGALPPRTPGGGRGCLQQKGAVLSDLPEGAVYRDEYDDLCDVALRLATALRPFAASADQSCTCPGDSHYVCPWHEAKDALKNYEDGDR